METPPPLPVEESRAARKKRALAFKTWHLFVLVVPLSIALGLSAGYLLWGRQAATLEALRAAQADATPSSADQQQIKRYDIPTAGNPSLGAEDAPITLVEFSDYECPYCKKWHDEVFLKLVDAYAGKVRFVYRDFPLVGLHSNAAPAAEAAHCAAEQTDYWTYHDLLFSMKYDLNTQGYEQYAADLGLDLTKFDECLTSRRYQQEVEDNYQFAANLGVQSTPTFFINGIPVVGAQSYEVFTQVIDKELAGEFPNKIERGDLMKKFIAVAGNIGVGKSTLVEMLCQKLDWQPFYEPEAANPYLADFYQDMQAWAFHSQIFFLTHRLRSHRQLLNFPHSAIQDRSIYEDAEIFAHNLFLQGYISQRDYQTYHELYLVLTEFLDPPDLVIYLRASVPTLLERIQHRNRDYERTISPDYLERLNRLYENWIANFTLCPVLTVPADDLDYVAHPSHLDLVAQKVQEKLTGKEEVVFDPEEVARANGE